MPVQSFGRNGVVDLKQENDQTIDLVTGEVGLHAAPVVAGNTIIVGAAHLSGGVPRGKSNVKGFIRGFDVRSGKRLWIFHTIPRPGQFGSDTWLGDSWVYTGNTGVWAQMSVDEELGLAYLPVEAPTGDYYGGHRHGNNLFSESIVAVDLKTGQRRWHYQTVHHGIWDHDIPCAPILADITVNGKTIKVLAQPTKQAFLFVLDRATGRPIWPIEERPVEKGDVPGEAVRADEAVPARRARQSVPIRSEWLLARRPDRFHARAARRSRKGDRAIQDRSDLHASGRQPRGRTARHAVDGDQRRGNGLGGRVVRS